jgi:hypothetical protein
MEKESEDTARKRFNLLWVCLLAVLLVSCSTLYDSWSRFRQSGKQTFEKHEEKRIPLPPLAEEFEK